MIRDRMMGKDKHLVQDMSKEETDKVSVSMLDQKRLITSMREVAIAPVQDVAVEDLDVIMRAEGIDAMSYQD